MSSHNEQVEPTRFDVATPPAEDLAAAVTSVSDAATATPSWVIPALIGLTLLAGAVFFVLPELVQPNLRGEQTTSPASSAATSGAAANQKQSAETASPWSDAQLTKLRKDAQDVLAELLEIQSQLEQSAAELWAADAFAAAKILATEADTLYRERDYVAAKSGYEAARDAMQAVLQERPEAMAAQLAVAEEAIETGDAGTARAALDIAAQIAADHPELPALEERLATVPAVQALLDSAAQAERSDNLASAKAELQQALALDPAHRLARAELERVSAAHAGEAFTEAMSEGYQALEDNRFDAARSAFTRAGKLVVDSAEVASALQEVAVAQTAYRLTRLQRSGAEAEASERWQDAVDSYEEALKRDSNVLFAQQGLERSRERAKLDSQFRTAIAEPSRLADAAVAKAMSGLLQQARNIPSPGPLLSAQITELESLIALANTPIDVTLRSDGQTEVTVYKVARLGQFQSQQLSLRPGVYTAVGIRNGYRDVRVTFTLAHNVAPADVLVRCTEKI